MLLPFTIAWLGCTDPSKTPTGDDGPTTTAPSPDATTVETAGDTASTPPETADTAGPTPTADSGLPTAAPALTGDCVLTGDNALRAWCDLAVDPPAAVEVSFVAAGGTERVHPGDGEAGEHRVGLYFLPPDTDVHWEARTVDAPGPQAVLQGVFRTDPLPVEAQADITRSGSWTVEHYLHVGPCESHNVALVTRSSDGEVLWYQAFEPGRFVALHHTEDDTVVGVSGDRFLQEFDWMGQPLLTVEEPASSGIALHHDVFRSDGVTYTLTYEYGWVGGEQLRFDGLVGYDQQGDEVVRWWLADAHVPTGPHPRHGADISHANAIFVRDGVALVSFRHLSMVAAVVVAPGIEQGDLLWTLEGYPAESFVGSTFELYDLDGTRATFQQQHDVRWLANGRLSLYDNGIPDDRLSRGLEIDLDFSTFEATVVQQYVLDAHCGFQGGSARTEAGDAVLTCGPEQRAVVFAAGTDAVVWGSTYTCPDEGDTRVLPRLVPLDL